MSEIALDEDLQTLEKCLARVDRVKTPLKWYKFMNLRGILYRSLGNLKESEASFIKAMYVEEPALKCKVMLNFAKTNITKKDVGKAMQLIERVFDHVKKTKDPSLDLFVGHAHIVRGQLYFLQREHKRAISEFMRAEYYFEGATDLRGVGVSCLEVARIHINAKNLTTAWNFLRKAENFLSQMGEEEQLGVGICKGIALYYSGKEEEALKYLRKIYQDTKEFGKGNYLVTEILDIYLNSRNNMMQFQIALM